ISLVPPQLHALSLHDALPICVPLAVRDVRSEPRWKNVPSVDVGRFTSMLSVPLVSRDEVIGVMNVQTVEPRDFDRTEIDFLQTRSEEHTSELQSLRHLVCRLL